jgi:hypothetical protein
MIRTKAGMGPAEATLAGVFSQYASVPSAFEIGSIKRFLIASTLLLLVATASIFGANAEPEKVDIKAAWMEGKVEITFIGKDEGERLELRITNVHPAALVIVVPEGTTTFPEVWGSGGISIVTSAAEETSLPIDSQMNKIFKQTGTTRFKSGSVMIRKYKAK